MKISYSAVIDSLWDKSLNGFRPDLLSDIQRPIIQVQIFEDQVNGSGLSSVFYNGGGELAYSSLEALKKINSTLTVEILQKGIALFPNSPIQKDLEQCREIMDILPEDFEDKWAELSDLFYSAEENLMELKLNYIKKYPEEFNLHSIGINEQYELPPMDAEGNYNYYVCEQDSDFDCIVRDDAFNPYSSHSLNLGMDLDLPKISLRANTNELPDAISNYKSVFIVNEKIRFVLNQFGIDYVQFFDIDITLKSGEIISDNYKAINLLNVVDVIDYEKSIIDWSELYEDEDEDDRYPERIHKLVLDLSDLEKDLVFKINKFELPTIMRGDLANELSKLGITGMSFYNVKDLTY